MFLAITSRFAPVSLIALLAITVAALGCGLFSSKESDAEMVFDSTEVGASAGEKVTQNLGPAGGTLVSPDGRLTLTIPKGALTETLVFSIQPITNKAGNGLGLAYRLEPDGRTFSNPLKISVRYDEKDLQGTVPEALSLAYQDKKGSWHAQKSAKLDQDAKTLTISSTHFTDFAFLARLRMNPTEATVYVGEDEFVGLADCPTPGILDRILSRPVNCQSAPHNSAKWELRGAGSIERQPHGTAVKYTAPAKKPTPNIAWIVLNVEFELWDETTGQITRASRSFASRITILDWGYKATGKTADVTYSGTICDLEKPFTVTGASSLNSFPFKFEPSSASEGSVSFGAAVPVIQMEGGGSYNIEGADTASPRIAMTMQSTGHTPIGSRSGGGTVYINLVPLDSDECSPK